MKRSVVVFGLAAVLIVSTVGIAVSKVVCEGGKDDAP